MDGDLLNQVKKPTCLGKHIKSARLKTLSTFKNRDLLNQVKRGPACLGKCIKSARLKTLHTLASSNVAQFRRKNDWRHVTIGPSVSQDSHVRSKLTYQEC